LRFRNLIAVVLLAACAGRARDALHAIPDYTPASSDVRGTEAAARRVPPDDRSEIFAEIVRQFFRPTMGQARWIDPQPLAHSRARAADSAIVEGDDWSQGIMQAAHLGRVCALGADPECKGRPGTVLRFSPPYAVGADSAIVYVRFRSVAAGQEPVPVDRSAFEMEFRMARREREWRIASKGTIVQPER
jgi:hypothetical protein